MQEARLRGQRILIVEDHYLIAVDTARLVRNAGAEVFGPYHAQALARTSLDDNRPTAAILDVNLGVQDSFSLARTLLERGIPMVFVTGHIDLQLPPELAQFPCLTKPVADGELVQALAGAIGI